MRRASSLILGLTVLALACPVVAQSPEPQVSAFSPQGTVKQVRQAQAHFSVPMVPLGDPRLTDPFDVARAESGAGRWVDTSIWVYDFARDLPVGLRCTFTQEPVRREWFSEGTEPAATDSPDGSLKARQARITAPVGGTILALDPDIPAGRQRVPFEARDVMPGRRWLLDGVVLGAAVDFVLWGP